LKKYLQGPTVSRQNIEIWLALDKPFDDWLPELEGKIEEAAVAVLMVSQDFLTTSCVADYILPAFVEAGRRQGLGLTWVLISHCNYEETWIGQHTSSNALEKPLAIYKNDEAEIARELNEIAERVKAIRREKISTERRLQKAQGSIVPLMCDRSLQVNKFDFFFSSNIAVHHNEQGRPQIFVVHGPEGESHKDLVERFITSTVERDVQQRSMHTGEPVKLRDVPWPPDGAIKNDDTRLDLLIANLVRQLAECHGRDPATPYSVEDFHERLERERVSTVVIQHNIEAHSWTRNKPTQRLLSSYLRRLNARPTGPRFLIFLNVIYSAPGTSSEHDEVEVLPQKALVTTLSQNDGFLQQLRRMLFRTPYSRTVAVQNNAMEPLTVEPQTTSAEDMLNNDRKKVQAELAELGDSLLLEYEQEWSKKAREAGVPKRRGEPYRPFVLLDELTCVKNQDIRKWLKLYCPPADVERWEQELSLDTIGNCRRYEDVKQDLQRIIRSE
jgi:hypothetical protein